jgi:hypothetical protein
MPTHGCSANSRRLVRGAQLLAALLIGACGDDGASATTAPWQCVQGLGDASCLCQVFRPGWAFNSSLTMKSDVVSVDRCGKQVCCIASMETDESTVRGCACYDDDAKCQKYLADDDKAYAVPTCPPP